ncbi:MAG: enoyl-CoA hydratase/isomerase family protein [Acidimicrobiales bacterium]|nr:enoyl-CoA hydratase/isomerase family protein [Acidimicrobiales bacterium]MCB1015769.1 enoyl-CoA hydratase/isomerase family protein [Acidimicrobiales bacterium]MCB9372090.1 enoyl-CoA hydratase/isomerase family protein [Microthrixaceae bacterium]
MTPTDAPSSDEPLAVTRDGAVATLWLNRPAKRNAVTQAMWSGIATVCAQLGADPTVRVLVVRGTGEHFCAGADIAELSSLDDRTEYNAVNRAADDALAAFPRPTIADVRGSCVGGGAEIAISCDLRIAESTARFGITPARLGIVYPAFALERAVAVIGPAAAKHLLYSGELVGAERALHLGLVHEVHEPGQAGDRVRALAHELADERSLLTQLATKEMVASITATGAVAPDVEARWSARSAEAGDAAEGLAAFLERRPPRFTWTP